MSKARSTQIEQPSRAFDYDHEYPDYAPVGEELVLLAEHWHKTDVRLQWFIECCSYGRSDLRRLYYARDHIAKIGLLIGDEQLNRSLENVELELCAEWSADLRRAFLSGDQSDVTRLEDEWRDLDASVDSERILDTIAAGTREHPIASEEIERHHGMSEEHVWRTVQNLLLNDTVVCYDPVNMCLPVGMRSPGQPAYWVPANHDEAEAWLEEAPAALLRAKEAFTSIVHHRSKGDRERFQANGNGHGESDSIPPPLQLSIS
jgi:hypothetical protein